MVIRDIVVVGASAGGVEALSALFCAIPSSIPIAYFVTLHVSPRSRSCLPSILERTGRIPVKHPRDGQKISPGRIYVAPPDFHLLVGDGIVHLGHGPRERHVRPAINPMFRSAAQAYGHRVIGVVLSGLLDDGVEGLREIKRHGGLAVVQKDARFPYMPRNALAGIEIDHCLPVAQIRDLISPLPDLSRIPMAKELNSCRTPHEAHAKSAGYFQDTLTATPLTGIAPNTRYPVLCSWTLKCR
jgi:two-component system, chemotaxis family, protein-glutamate methylesterase/glutaminase